MKTSLLSLGLISTLFAADAFAGCNRGSFVCEASGHRRDGQWVQGQASTVACAGTQGVNVNPILENLCHQALSQCASQFRDQRFGAWSCRVTSATYTNNNGHFPQGQFIGRRLR